MGEYSVVDMLRIVLKRIWLVIIVGVLCASVAFIYCSMIATPTYQARACIIGSNGNVAADMDMQVSSSAADTSIKSNDLAASLSLTDTYVIMLKKMPTESQLFIDRITEAGLADYYNKKSTVSISANKDTLVIDITVVSTDREVAKQIANIYAECSSDFIADYNIGMIKTLSKARNAVQVSPRTILTTALSCLLGVAATAVIIIYLALSDRTINGEDDIKVNYDIPVLGVVPDFQSMTKGGSSRG